MNEIWNKRYVHNIAVTPDDYEPPGFQATSDEDFAFKEETTNIKVGDVLTVSIKYYYQNLVVYSLSLFLSFSLSLSICIHSHFQPFHT